MRAQTKKRFTIHLIDHERERLQVAAYSMGTSLSQFIVQAALEKAEQVIAAESSLVLTHRESVRPLELIENPPPRNERFLQAQARYQKLIAAENPCS